MNVFSFLDPPWVLGHGNFRYPMQSHISLSHVRGVFYAMSWPWLLEDQLSFQNSLLVFSPIYTELPQPSWAPFNLRRGEACLLIGSLLAPPPPPAPPAIRSDDRGLN